VTDAPAPIERPAPLVTLLLLAGVVVFMAGFFGLFRLLGVQAPYCGLLFLVYWGAILRQDRAAFFPTVLGGLAGVFMSWLLLAWGPGMGQAGTIVSVAALAVLLFCFMRGQARWLVNNATMLFLTVATIPDLHVATNAIGMAESLLLGAAYMGVVSAGATVVKRRAMGGSQSQQTP
jgi:hypothetical protein